MTRRRVSQVRAMMAVGRKEFRQIARDRQTLGLLLFVPLFFLLLYGYALNFDIRHIRIAVDDRDGSPDSRALVSAFTNSEYFDLVATVRSAGQVEALMARNAIRAALVIPDGFGRDARQGLQPAVQVIISGDNANTATTVLAYTRAIVREHAARYAGGGRAVPMVRAEPRVWFNPALETTLFLVPGLIAYIATITAVISTSMSLVREKERGTIEQVRMAPVDTLPFIAGKTAPYFGISLLSAFIVMLAAMALFGMPMRGSWLDLLLVTSLFLFGALGFGLLVSTIAESQQVAFQMATLASFLPTFVLSGFIFPISSMPVPIQLVTYVVPARYYLAALRAIVLKGSGSAMLLVELGSLTLFAAAMLLLAARRLARQQVA